MPVPVPVKTAELGNLNKAKQGCLMPYDMEIMRMNNHNSAQALAPQTRRSLHTTHRAELPTWRDRYVALLRGANMSLNGRGAPADSLPGTVSLPPLPTTPCTPIEWDWDVEHEDRKREAKADAALHDEQPFHVDRRVLKDIVREKTRCEVGRITFLSSGTFHKAYLVTFTDTRQLVARVARRFMPRLKTQSEIATMQYLREKTCIPVPDIYYYDSNPCNRLGGEYVLMSKASGIPLGGVYHSMSNEQLKILFKNVASLIIPLFAQRFSHIGSLHFHISRSVTSPIHSSSSSSTPTATYTHFKYFSSSATPTSEYMPTAVHSTRVTPIPVHVGPIVSWPFFGSGRGDLAHPSEIDRGPWSSTQAYSESCVQREISGVKRETEGKSAPHRLHLDPVEIRSSRHHHLDAVPDDQSDDSDEWDAQESEEEWDGPGDAMYSDYRRMQRSTFLIAHIMRREQSVRTEMGRWMRVMDRLRHVDDAGPEEFGLDCHDLNLENVFVDERDPTQITCIIDWESTTTRPLWACAHLPAFVQTSPFTSKLFREVVASIALSKSPKNVSLAATTKEWLHYEAVGARLRLAHRCVEWDGWEEGLVESILGPEEHEEEWFKDVESTVEGSEVQSPSSHNGKACVENMATSEPSSGALRVAALKSRKQAGQLPLKKAKESEQTLTTTGDICGGRGGELGRRLEAWLSVNGNGNGNGNGKRRCVLQEDYHAEAE
ncbi:hypothetical protein EV363DRAFT_1414549 [Boletus edulis]|nr:hypothetical protein EV363DRAFT_1414549 [Boletus edulis]